MPSGIYPRSPITLAQRIQWFWEKVSIHDSASCWEWLGARDPHGYGRFNIGRKLIVAHRFSYELSCGLLLPGFYALHDCDNPPCCNPAHLYPGTHWINGQDAAARNRHHRGEKHHATKVTDEQIREILRLYGTYNQQQLADMYGLSNQHVSELVRGKHRATRIFHSLNASLT